MSYLWMIQQSIDTIKIVNANKEERWWTIVRKKKKFDFCNNEKKRPKKENGHFERNFFGFKVKAHSTEDNKDNGPIFRSI